jgi:hypothetical protein
MRPTETYMTRGSAGALPYKEAGSRTIGHVPTPEPSIGRRGPEPQDAWLCRSPPLWGGGVQSQNTCGSARALPCGEVCGTRGSARALLNKDAWQCQSPPQQGGSAEAHLTRGAGFRAEEHVVARGTTLRSLYCLHACSQGYPVYSVPTVAPGSTSGEVANL